MPGQPAKAERATSTPAASSAPTTRAKPGSSSTTCARGRSTSARSASIPTTTSAFTSSACRCTSRATAARRSATMRRRGVHADHHALWIDPQRLRPPGPRQRRRPVLSYDRGAQLGASREPADRPVLRRRRGHAQAVPRLRRLAGQRHLGRPERHAQRRTASPPPTGSACLAATASTARSIRPIPTPSMPRGSTAACAASTCRHRRRGASIRPRAAAGRAAGLSLQLEFADPAVAARPDDASTTAATTCSARRNRGDNWESISPDLTRGKPGRSADYRPHHHDHRRVAAARPACSTPAPTTAGVHVSRNGGARLDRPVATTCPACPRTAGSAASSVRTSPRGPPTSPSTGIATTTARPTCSRRPTTARPGSRWRTTCRDERPGPRRSAIVAQRGPALRRHRVRPVRVAGRRRDWQQVTNGLPTVAVHDLVIHPRDRELVIGTHGRSIYVMDIAPLEE